MRTLVKELALYECSIAELQHVLLDADFKRRFLESQGDSGIDVSEWMEGRRIVCYSMRVEKNKPETTKCLERERYWFDGSNELRIEQEVNGGSANIFHLTIAWLLRDAGARNVAVRAEISVTCNTNSWLAGMLGNIVEEAVLREAGRGVETLVGMAQDHIDAAQDAAEAAAEAVDHAADAAAAAGGGGRRRATWQLRDRERSPRRLPGSGELLATQQQRAFPRLRYAHAKRLLDGGDRLSRLWRRPRAASQQSYLDLTDMESGAESSGGDDDEDGGACGCGARGRRVKGNRRSRCGGTSLSMGQALVLAVFFVSGIGTTVYFANSIIPS